MLSGMTWGQFLEWKTYDELEPFGEERDDYRSAQVVQALYNIFTRTKREDKAWPLSEFLLGLGDVPRAAVVPQSVEYQEMLIDAWCFVNNETLIKQ